MRRSTLVLISSLALSGPLHSEPLTLEQAPNVAQKGQLELGLKASYAVDEFTLKGLSGTDFTVTNWSNTLFLRCGWSDRWEMMVDAPHSSLKTEQETAGRTTSASESGLGDIGLAVKRHWGDAATGHAYGARLTADLPT